MSTIAPINYIEITEEGDEKVVRVAGTRITVGEIAFMHLEGDSPVEWIVENFEVLNHAQVYAALSYYYDHKEEIDAAMRRAAEFAEAQADATLDELIARAKAKLKDDR